MAAVLCTRATNADTFGGRGSLVTLSLLVGVASAVETFVDFPVAVVVFAVAHFNFGEDFTDTNVPNAIFAGLGSGFASANVLGCGWAFKARTFGAIRASGIFADAFVAKSSGATVCARFAGDDRIPLRASLILTSLTFSAIRVVLTASGIGWITAVE